MARRSCGLAGASSLSLLGWQQLAGHGEALLALGFQLVFHLWVCKGGQSVHEQKSKEPERVHVDRAEEKGVSKGRSCLQREHITMVMCLYTWGEKTDQLVDWKWWESFAVLILTVSLKIAHGFFCHSQRSCIFLFQASALRKAFL